jgi:hypothetical protein
MKENKYLFVGGLVAMGLDKTGDYLLTVTHSGRGDFDTRTWERVARDKDLAYPEQQVSEGIGPLAGQRIAVVACDETREKIEIEAPNGQFHLIGESSGITVIKRSTESTR